MGQGPLGTTQHGQTVGESSVDHPPLYVFPTKPDLFSGSWLTGPTPGGATSHPSDSLTPQVSAALSRASLTRLWEALRIPGCGLRIRARPGEQRAQPPSAAIRRSCRLPPAALPWPGFTGNV